MPFISDTQIARVQATMGSLAARANRAKEMAARQAGHVKTLAEIAGGAAAIGFLRGKYEADGSTFTIPGTTIDIELAAGLGLAGAALFEVFGKYDDDALNVGAGILAHYAGQVFRNYGKTSSFSAVAGGATGLISGGATGLISGHHNYPTLAGDGMSSALQSALSASV
jgi:hypothetical protein